MLAAIRPSELCGMESRLPPPDRKFSFGVEIFRDPSIRGSASEARARIRRRDSRSISMSDHVPTSMHEASSASHIQTMSALPQRSASSCRVPSRDNSTLPIHDQASRHVSASRRRRKNSVISFLSSKEPSSQTRTAYAKDRSTLTSNARRSSRHDDAQQTIEAEPDNAHALRRLSLSGRRRSQRPDFTTFSSGSDVSRSLLGSLTSRPQSLAMRPAPPREWFPPSSSDSDKTTTGVPASHAIRGEGTLLQVEKPLASHFDDSDDSSVEASFLSEFKRSPAAAYMLRASRERVRLRTRAAPTSNTTTDNAGNRTVWFSDTEREEATTLSTPGSAITPRDNVIFWSPPKAQNIIVDTRELPLTTENRSDRSDKFVSTDATQSPASRPLHVTTSSRSTNSTGDTVTSPTFSADHGLTTEVSPPSSMDMMRPGEGMDSDLLSPRNDTFLDDAASIAPSVVSERWTQSPKERLGLGGSLKRNAISPWEAEENVPRRRVTGLTTSKLKPNRFSTLMGWAS